MTAAPDDRKIRDNDVQAIYEKLTAITSTQGQHSGRLDTLGIQLNRLTAIVERRGNRLDELAATQDEHTAQLSRLTAIVERQRNRLDELAATQDERTATLDSHTATQPHSHPRRAHFNPRRARHEARPDHRAPRAALTPGSGDSPPPAATGRSGCRIGGWSPAPLHSPARSLPPSTPPLPGWRGWPSPPRSSATSGSRTRPACRSG